MQAAKRAAEGRDWRDAFRVVLVAAFPHSRPRTRAPRTSFGRTGMKRGQGGNTPHSNRRTLGAICSATTRLSFLSSWSQQPAIISRWSSSGRRRRGRGLSGTAPACCRLPGLLSASTPRLRRSSSFVDAAGAARSRRFARRITPRSSADHPTSPAAPPCSTANEPYHCGPACSGSRRQFSLAGRRAAGSEPRLPAPCRPLAPSLRPPNPAGVVLAPRDDVIAVVVECAAENFVRMPREHLKAFPRSRVPEPARLVAARSDHFGPLNTQRAATREVSSGCGGSVRLVCSNRESGSSIFSA